MTRQMTGAEMVVQALIDQGVAISSAIPAARCCRSTTRSSSRTRSATSWCATSRVPGTPRKDTRAPPARSASRSSPPARAPPISSRRSPTRCMDSIPMVGITGQVPTHLIGNDAFQECDTVGITRAVHQTQLAGEGRGRPRPRPARGILRREPRPPGPGGGGYSEGRAVRHRHLLAAGPHRAPDVPPPRRGRPGRDPRSGRR